MQNNSNNIKEFYVSIQWSNFRFFYRASSWLWQFLWEDHMLEVFAPSFLCVWSQMPWRKLQIRVSPWGFLHKLLRFGPWIYSICSFWYVLISSLCGFLSLALVGYLLLHRDAVFILSDFFLLMSPMELYVWLWQLICILQLFSCECSWSPYINHLA